MARDAGADRKGGAAIDEELGNFGVRGSEMRECMEDRRLTADAARVDVGGGVDVRAAVEEKAGGVEKAIFGGDVEEGCAPESEQATTRYTAIQFGVVALEERRVGIKEGGEFVGAAAKDREHPGNVVPCAGPFHLPGVRMNRGKGVSLMATNEGWASTLSADGMRPSRRV